MKKTKILALLLLGMTLGFASCGDDDDDDNGNNTTNVAGKVYNPEAVNAGREAWKTYSSNEGNKVVQIATAASIVLDLKSKDKTYQADFWVGVSAEKFGYGDKLDEAAKKAEEVKNIFASTASEQPAVDEEEVKSAE